MLFRRCQTYITSFALTFCILDGLNADQKKVSKEGKDFAKNMHAQNLIIGESINTDELLPLDQRGKVFDADLAKRCAKEQNIPSSDINEFLQDPKLLRYQEHKLEASSISHADSLINQTQTSFDSDEEYKFETCLQHDAPFEIEVRHSLNVKINQISEINNVHVCKGHSNEIYCISELCEKMINQEKKRLASDPTIKSYKVRRIPGEPIILTTWTHHNNTDKCHHYKIEQSSVENGCTEVQDEWIVENPETEKKAHTPDCTLIKSIRSKPETKIIDGIEVSRSWEKVDSYMCRYEPTKCPFFNSYLCRQIERKCKTLSGDECALWEITFKCRINSKIRTESDDVFGTNEKLWDSEYKPNASFSDAITKLQIFDEMKREFEKSKNADVRKLQIFSGMKSQCSKNVAEDLMYDCCFSFQGLANDIKLSKCSSDEIALAEMREKGLCHYVGSYDEKFLELWKSRKEHVFCCFPSKLARVLHQEGRKQLKIDWGTPENPNCKGFTQKELQQLNFSKIDLSDAYEVQPSVDMTNKIQLIEERLKRRIAECEGTQ